MALLGGWGGKGRPPRGVGRGERGRGQADQHPSGTSTMRAPGLAGGAADSDGGGHGRAFSPGAQRHPGHGSPHYSPPDYPEHLEISGDSPLPRPPSRRRRRRRRGRPRAPPSPSRATPPSQAFSRDDAHGRQKPACVTLALTLGRVDSGRSSPRLNCLWIEAE